MNAIVQERYGPPDVLELREMDVPVPRGDEVLVRVRAASVHPDVWHVVRGRPYVLRLMGAGVRRPDPPIPGTDFAGTVEAVGAEVADLQPGDDVFGESLRGMQWHHGGTFAEYAAVPADLLALKPPNVSFQEAAAVPTSGIIAVHNLGYGAMLREDQRVLVNGAAGGVGSIALQLARARGAHVTGVDHGDRLEVVRALGADAVVDYTREDFTRGEARFDLVFDVASNLSLASCRRVLSPRGLYVRIGHDHYGASGGRVLGSIPGMLGLTVRTPFSRHLPPPNFAMPAKREAMAMLRDLLASGQLTPVVGRTYPLAEAAEALRALERSEVPGRIVLVM
jgi:NADPH:quinone reductase-like Zn-dependent oxidoreductase